MAERDTSELSDLTSEVKLHPSAGKCLAYFEACSSVSPLYSGCTDVLKYTPNTCLLAHLEGPASRPIFDAHDRIRVAALLERGVDVAAEARTNEELELALARPWDSAERVALFLRIDALEDKHAQLEKDLGTQMFVQYRAHLAQLAQDAAGERLRSGTDDDATRDRLFDAARKVDGDGTKLLEGYQSKGNGAEAKNEAELAALRASGVVARVRSAMANRKYDEARSELAAVTRLLLEEGNHAEALRFADVLGDAVLADQILDQNSPPPWGAVRAAARERAAAAAQPATAAVLRRALIPTSYRFRFYPWSELVEAWDNDRSLTGVAEVASCPRATPSAVGGMLVEGVTCGTESRSDGSRVIEGSSSTSRIQYRDGSGIETRTTTTTTPDQVIQLQTTFYTVKGQFQFRFGHGTVVVPFQERIGPEISLDWGSPQHKTPEIYKDVIDVANAELIAARKKILATLRSKLDEQRDTPAGDELAAKILILSDQPEPEVVEYFRTRFSLPPPSAGDRWSGY